MFSMLPKQEGIKGVTWLLPARVWSGYWMHSLWKGGGSAEGALGLGEGGAETCG